MRSLNSEPDQIICAYSKAGSRHQALHAYSAGSRRRLGARPLCSLGVASVFHALPAVSQTAHPGALRGQISAPSRAWPALAARWRASGCAKLRRGAPHPRLDTELAAPGANRRTMLRHGAVRPQACELTEQQPGRHGWPDVLPRQQGSPGNGRRVPAAGQVSMDWRIGRSSWSLPPRPSQAPGSADYASNPGGEAEPDPGWPGRRSCRPRCCTLLLYSPLNCSNFASDLWSYGDSNPGPLACHQWAGRPQQCVAAGHRP
jgi:hypothetical protein